jgi:DNA-binding HxlR family transcriptional regulator
MTKMRPPFAQPGESRYPALVKPVRRLDTSAADPLARFRPKFDRLRNGCPLRAAVDVVRGRWKPSILFFLSQRPQRFTELFEKLPGITAQTLTLQLRQLEADRVVRRTVHAGAPLRVEYALTESGEKLWEIVLQLEQWAADHLAEAETGS